ncbi:MAG TPA: ATP-binding cassette domain-containing protein [Solirubrobacteraceae bacterium]
MPGSRGVLAARRITKSYAEVVVLDRLSITVTPGIRLGVVGPNGIGKSTLLRVLAGLEPPDSGVVTREPAGLSVAYFAQEPDEVGRSGGETARAKLAEIIESGAEILLLDEPTNNLDAAGLELLGGFVGRHRGGIVVVSHDRAFLEGMTRIVEVEADTRRVHTFTGGWSEFEAERRRRRDRQATTHRRYAAERGRIEEQGRRMRQWEERGYGQGRKKKKGKDVAKAFEKKLSRIETVEKPWSPWRLELQLGSRQRGGDVVARLEEAVVERNEFRLGPIDLELRHGDRLAILGDNGAGKTTVVKALLGELALRSGRRWVGPSVVLGAIPQGVSPFSKRDMLLDEFIAGSAMPAQEARSLLAKFGLSADHVERPGSSLSPGERTRAMIALLSSRGVNALVLDEPTNHLDLEAIEQLEAALEGFDGTAVLVSHDRRFLEGFNPNRTVQISHGRGREIRGVRDHRS